MRLGPREITSVARVVAQGSLGRYAGPGASQTDRLERSLEKLLGVEHALAVNSGTSALMAALAAVGVGPGDEVVVPAYTWVATAAATLALGAVPVLAEIDESLTLDPIDLKGKITSQTRAVIPVHMLNLVADMDALLGVASEAGLSVVEDAAQALGVLYKGKPVGGLGDAGAFSFSQTKNVTSGEGGAVVTNNSRTASRATMFHDVGSYIRSGWQPTDEPLFVGMNLKMSELSSAVLVPQLARLERQLAQRRARRAAMLEELRAEPSIHVSPHHSSEEAVGLTVYFDDPADAVRFAAQRGAHRLLDSSRHVYTNWASLLGRRTFHERFSPYEWAGRQSGTFDETSCPRTLEVLARTCAVTIRPDLPLVVHRRIARQLAGYRSAG